jgi:hypothetical protein
MPHTNWSARPSVCADRGSHVTRIVHGGIIPDYELSDHRGMRRTMSELQGGDPLVPVLARGGFCPKDRRQREGLLQLHRENAGRLLPSRDDLDRQPADRANEFRTTVGAGWTFLSEAVAGEVESASIYAEHDEVEDA